VEHRHLLPDEIDLLLDDEAGFGVAPLKAHVRRCAECRAELEDARAVLAALDQLPHLAPSPLFAERVMQQVTVFEPWHVAALNSARRLVPQSAPARAIAALGGLSAAAILTVATFWMVARLDMLVFLVGAGIERARTAMLGAVSGAVTAALGEPALAMLRADGGMGAALVLTAFVLSLVLAAAGLRLAAGASRRRRG
jgi:hypothetical protein